ncbi:MAG: hypoxanthine phosphoribosyltransferase [Candidatus Acetothermia bacterium]|jgi:hypoxanthine phosphoribosyltransferase|nr:hypoxanthine phosphoribosyltransferase [Candidatus Acetothermia bacterium]MDH7506092.1 hypoxanthine phosphoribosyltransferase [Candidatus Acetothermia bacterium]
MAQGKGLKKILLSEEEIRRRVAELGAQITKDYRALVGQASWEKQLARPLLVVGLLRGVVIFLADLVRTIDVPLRYDFMTVSSYGNADSPGELLLLKDLVDPIQGQDILIVEDIVDTGQTLSYVQRTLKARKPRSLRTCCLIDKTPRREVEVQLDYVGFRLEENEFLVGYGLDYAGLYRNLPYIAALETR